MSFPKNPLDPESIGVGIGIDFESKAKTRLSQIIFMHLGAPPAHDELNKKNRLVSDFCCKHDGMSAAHVRRRGISHLLIPASLILLLSVPSLTRAQSVSIGLTAGLPLNDLATASDSLATSTGRYTIGPIVQVKLPRAFAVDVEVLYKRLDFGLSTYPARIVVHRLELPLLVRYTFRGSSFHPFVHVGMTFNRTIPAANGNACPATILGKGFYCIGDNIVAQLRHPHTHGPVLGTGVEFGPKSVRLTPEIRITRWVDRNFGTQDSLLRSNLTQVELLLGFRF